MTHLDPKRGATTSELRQFGLLVGGAFLVIAMLTLWRHRPIAVVSTFGALGGILAISGLLVPTILRRVYAGWMRFAVLLSKVTTPIFMGIIYFVVITPVGMLMRAAGRHPFKTTAAGSAWVTRGAGTRRSDLERQF